MSLLRASLAARRRAGAILLAALAGASAAVLLASGRTFGRGIRLEVEVASTGALKADAKVKIAGRVVGEVRGMRRERAPDGTHAVIDLFVAREWAGDVRRDSTVFIATPTVLGEAYLEIGPPTRKPGDARPPGPPVADGERLRGADPPEIDRLLARLYRDLTTIVALLREHRPAIDELLRAGDELLASLAGLPADAGQLGRIRDHAGRAAEDAIAIYRALDGGDAVPRVRALARDLADTAERAVPELTDLGDRVARAAARIEELGDLFTPARRERIARGLAAFARAIDTGSAVARDVQALADRVARGMGTLGAFAADRELYDDFHETHRILKWEFWRLPLKVSRPRTLEEVPYYKRRRAP